jgi:hypothetical protein
MRCAVTRLLFFLVVFSLQGNSQWLSVGVTGGVPVSPHSATYSSAIILVNPSSSDQATSDVTLQAPNDFYQKPYAVGPTVEINLPWRFSLQEGMLYERFHQDVSEGITPSREGGVNFGFITSVAANAFSFPLLARYNFARHRIKPFIEAGATLRHLGTFTGEGIQLDFHLHPNSTAFQFDPGKAVDVAVTGGVGFRYRVAIVDVVPEIRILHWTAQYEQPAQNQAMLTLTFTFPAL